MRTAFKSFLLSALVTTSFGVVATNAAAAPKAKAQKTDSVAQFRIAAVSIPTTLMNAGYDSFGRLKLADLIDQARTVPVTPVNELHRVQMAGDNEMDRSSAQWSRSNGDSIKLNQKMWVTTSAEAQKVLALHENLGAAGYNDDDYLMSTGMWVLTRPEIAHLNDTEKNGVVERITASAGGITGVGGGGDVFGASVKMRMLLSSLDRVSKSSGEDRADSVNFFYSVFYMGMEIHRNSYLGLGPDGQYHVISR